MQVFKMLQMIYVTFPTRHSCAMGRIYVSIVTLAFWANIQKCVNTPHVAIDTHQSNLFLTPCSAPAIS
jgi:hypothetical protein